MEDGDVPAFPQRTGDLGTEHIVFEDRDATGVLHGTSIEVWHENLIVFGERVRGAELFFEELETGLRGCEEVIGIDVFRERCAGVHAKRNGTPVFGPIDVGGAFVRPGDDRRDVGRDAWRGWEDPARDVGVGFCGVFSR